MVSRSLILVPKFIDALSLFCVFVDIFGDLNVAYTKADETTKKTTVGTIKIGYDGTMKKHSTNEFNLNRIEGITAKSLDVDNSGDVYIYGQEQWNRNEFILDFTSTKTDTGFECVAIKENKPFSHQTVEKHMKDKQNLFQHFM